MAVSNISSSSRPSAFVQHEIWSPESRRKSAPRLQIMPSRPLPLRVAVVGNHLPRQCGIATFTTDLCDAMAAEYGAGGVSVVAINDPRSLHAYPARVRLQIEEGDISSYRAAANFLNGSHVDIVSLQHEYGIFGGNAGGHVLELLQHLTMPVVTTLHTVLRQPDIHQQFVMQQIAARSERLIVMSEYSSRVLQDVFGVTSEKIDMIPHGIPDLAFVESDAYKDLFSLGKNSVLLTFGLLSPNKGFESVIQALPRILSRAQRSRLRDCGRNSPPRQSTRRGSIPGTVADAGQRIRSGARGSLPQQVCQRQRDGCAGGLCRHLHHALLSRVAGCIWDVGVCHGRGQGDHLDSILARRRASR